MSRRTLMTLAAGLALMLLTTGAALIPTGGVVAQRETDDRDCRDFSSQKKAQRFFEEEGGPRRDRHRLDADDDGIACEDFFDTDEDEDDDNDRRNRRNNDRNTERDNDETTSGGDRDCDDFDTQEEAQEFFEDEGGPESDPHRLDADDDGIACETLP